MSVGPGCGGVVLPSRVLRRCWFVLSCCGKPPPHGPSPSVCVLLKPSVFCFEPSFSVGSACDLRVHFVPQRMQPFFPPTPSAFFSSCPLFLSHDLFVSCSLILVLLNVAPSLGASLHSLPLVSPLSVLPAVDAHSFTHRPVDHPGLPASLLCCSPLCLLLPPAGCPPDDIFTL